MDKKKIIAVLAIAGLLYFLVKYFKDKKKAESKKTVLGGATEYKEGTGVNAPLSSENKEEKKTERITTSAKAQNPFQVSPRTVEILREKAPEALMLIQAQIPDNELSYSVGNTPSVTVGSASNMKLSSPAQLGNTMQVHSGSTEQTMSVSNYN